MVTGLPWHDRLIIQTLETRPETKGAEATKRGMELLKNSKQKLGTRKRMLLNMAF